MHISTVIATHIYNIPSDSAHKYELVDSQDDHDLQNAMKSMHPSISKCTNEKKNTM